MQWNENAIEVEVGLEYLLVQEGTLVGSICRCMVDQWMIFAAQKMTSDVSVEVEVEVDVEETLGCWPTPEAPRILEADKHSLALLGELFICIANSLARNMLDVEVGLVPEIAVGSGQSV